MFKINRLISNLINYRKKILLIIFFEIIYSIKYRVSGNNYKIQNHDSRTDSIPCPYFFIHEIAKFVNEKKISDLIDLGSGFGRITNFLNDNTNASISTVLFNVARKILDPLSNVLIDICGSFSNALIKSDALCIEALNFGSKISLPFNASAAAIYDEIAEKIFSWNGTISAEHGIGKKKKKYFYQMLGNNNMEDLKKIKHILDPQNRLGKGNIF